MTIQIEEPVACIACGCTEYEPCPGGCTWAVMNPETGNAICTSCVKKPLGELVKLAASQQPRRIAAARISP